MRRAGLKLTFFLPIRLLFPPGETGIGKSTLMDTLFNTNFENFEASHFEPQVKLRAQTYDLQESNVRLRLTVVNTVGFGDQMNKQERWAQGLEVQGAGMHREATLGLHRKNKRLVYNPN